MNTTKLFQVMVAPEFWGQVRGKLPSGRFSRGDFMFHATIDPEAGPCVFVWGNVDSRTKDWSGLVPEIFGKCLKVLV